MNPAEIQGMSTVALKGGEHRLHERLGWCVRIHIDDISYGNLVQAPVLIYLVGILRTALRGVRQSNRQ